MLAATPKRRRFREARAFLIPNAPPDRQMIHFQRRFLAEIFDSPCFHAGVFMVPNHIPLVDRSLEIKLMRPFGSRLRSIKNVVILFVQSGCLRGGCVRPAESA